MPPATPPSDEVEAYLAACSPAARGYLEQIRERVQALVPEGEERLSYRMPTTLLAGKVLCHYGGFTDHVSMFPVPPGDEADDRVLAAYRKSKGTLSFPLDQPLPIDVVDRIVRLHRARLGA